MADVFDYLFWRGDLDFETLFPNEADCLMLCMLSFVDFSDIVFEHIGMHEITLQEAVTRYFDQNPEQSFVPSRLITWETRRFVAEMAKCRRFASLLLSGYQSRLIKGSSPDEQLQFGALCVRRGNRLWVIYRGTDDTLIGWKENFNSDHLYPIPAQVMAADYLEQAARCSASLTVLGHSKGGNLAVYAAVASAVPTDRIDRVYDYDGPGFDRSFFVSARYLQLRERILKFIPEYPIIGLIKHSEQTKAVIKSRGKGLSQHNAFHWQYTPIGLERAGRIDPGALLLNSRLKRCCAGMSPDRRRGFIEGVYHLASAGGRETLEDLSLGKRRLLQDYKRLGKEEKDNLKLVLAELVRHILTDTEKQNNS